jgi:hypothetical protein
VHLVLRLRGGGGPPPVFAAITGKSDMEQGSFCKYAPPWRCVEGPLSLKGFCHNPKCKASGQEVISSLLIEGQVYGQGEVRFSLVEDLAKCPMCYTVYAPTSCVFAAVHVHKCFWRLFGTMVPTKENKWTEKHISTTFTEVKGDFIQPKQTTEDNQVPWSSLVLVASSVGYNNDECSICCIPKSATIEEQPTNNEKKDEKHDNRICTLECGHWLHSPCAKALAKFRADCPLCRVASDRLASFVMGDEDEKTPLDAVLSISP